MTELKLYPISGCCHCPAFGGCQYTWDTCPLDTDGEIPGWLRDRLNTECGSGYNVDLFRFVLSLKKEDEE